HLGRLEVALRALPFEREPGEKGGLRACAIEADLSHARDAEEPIPELLDRVVVLLLGEEGFRATGDRLMPKRERRRTIARYSVERAASLEVALGGVERLSLADPRAKLPDGTEALET